MLEETVKDYCSYIKLEVAEEIAGVQEVIDNMLTRLEEFSSVLSMIKAKNIACASSVSEEIAKYRIEVTTLSRQISVLEEVVSKVASNADMLEKHVEKAEADLGVSSDNKLKMLLKPFLSRSKDVNSSSVDFQPGKKIELESVIGYFDAE